MKPMNYSSGGRMREAIDFGHVADNHHGVHGRLINWARWCNGGASGSSTHPMWRGYRAPFQEATPMATPVDRQDALRVQRAFMHLPEDHRWTLNWSYCRPYIPVLRVRQALAVTTPALFQLLQDARTMMRNRLNGIE